MRIDADKIRNQCGLYCAIASCGKTDRRRQPAAAAITKMRQQQLQTVTDGSAAGFKLWKTDTRRQRVRKIQIDRRKHAQWQCTDTEDGWQETRQVTVCRVTEPYECPELLHSRSTPLPRLWGRTLNTASDIQRKTKAESLWKIKARDLGYDDTQNWYGT